VTGTDATHYIRYGNPSRKAIIYVEQSPFNEPISIMALDAAAKDTFYQIRDKLFTCSRSNDSNYDVPTSIDTRFTFVADSETSETHIPDGGRLWFYAYNCSGHISVPKLSMYLREPSGWLSPSRFPVVPMAWIETAYYVVLLVLWTINRLHHKAMGLVIHNLIFVAIFLGFVNSFSIGAQYSVANSIKGREDLIYSAEYVPPFRNAALLMLSLFFASGVSTVIDCPSVRQTAIYVVGCVVFSVAEFLITSHVIEEPSQSLAVSIILIGIYLISYVGYVVLFYYYSMRTLRILEAHLAMIDSVGIDPETTPTRRKIQMVARLRTCGALVFFVFVLSTIVYLLAFVAYWVLYLITTLMVIAMFGLISWVCRIRSKMVAQYGNDQEAYVVRDTQESKPWQPGMVLPPLPTAEYNPNVIHAGDHDDEP
jgi:hypothetical protein